MFVHCMRLSLPNAQIRIGFIPKYIYIRGICFGIYGARWWSLTFYSNVWWKKYSVYFIHASQSPAHYLCCQCEPERRPHITNGSIMLMSWSPESDSSVNMAGTVCPWSDLNELFIVFCLMLPTRFHNVSLGKVSL